MTANFQGGAYASRRCKFECLEVFTCAFIQTGLCIISWHEGTYTLLP